MFFTESKNDSLKLAIDLFNERLYKESTWRSWVRFCAQEGVSGLHMSLDRDGNKVTPEGLMNIFLLNRIPCEVRLFKPWFFSKKVGYYKGGKVIYVSRKKLPSMRGLQSKYKSTRERNIKKLCSLIATMGHEYGHMVDGFVPEYLGHGDNKRAGKQHTATYFIGTFFNRYFNILFRDEKLSLI